MTLHRTSIPSPNFSSRGGENVRLIVLHTAEGALNIQDLGHFFANPAVQASSHNGADDTPNTVAQYVGDGFKAWTVAAYNPVSVNLELCAFADWTTAQWMQHPQMLANCAAWIAEESERFKIPIVKLTDAQAQGGGRGVCQHSNLGVAGGGHHDCGPGFPIDLVLDMAKRGSGPDPHYDWFWAKELPTVREYDLLRAAQTRTAHPRRARLAFLRARLRFYAARVWTVSHTSRPPSWGQFHRGWRYQQLIHRAQGKRVV